MKHFLLTGQDIFESFIHLNQIFYIKIFRSCKYLF